MAPFDLGSSPGAQRTFRRFHSRIGEILSIAIVYECWQSRAYEDGLLCGIVITTQGMYDFQTHLLNPSNEPSTNVTSFAFDDYFPAVATTDILCRVADVLTCKPSELAFYPSPKFNIRRVGDHEADSARRAQLTTPDLLISMNQAVIKNNI
jgi:hypothetical protein